MGRERRVVVGIDIGGTNLRCAVAEIDGTVTDRLRMSTAKDLPSFLRQIADSVSELCGRAVSNGAVPSGVGVGMPGLISPSGTVFSSVNLTHCEGINLEAELCRLTGLPVAVVNDANAAAYGEYRFGAGQSFRSFIMITIGTGIGSGILLDGRLWTGADGFAGEFGHLTVVPEGKSCPCGSRGCVEQYSSATAIIAAARESGAVDSPEDTVETLAALAFSGDGSASALFDDAGRYLGMAAASVINLLNLEAIIVGGGVAASFALIKDAMQAEILARSYRPSAERVSLLTGSLGDDAGILGAAAVSFDRFMI